VAEVGAHRVVEGMAVRDKEIDCAVKSVDARRESWGAVAHERSPLRLKATR
jgi:hypothetical protein